MPNLVVNPKMKSIIINGSEFEKCKSDTFRGEEPRNIFLALGGIEFDVYFLDSAEQQQGVFNITGTLPVSFCGKCIIYVKDSQFKSNDDCNDFCVKLTKSVIFS